MSRKKMPLTCSRCGKALFGWVGNASYGYLHPEDGPKSRVADPLNLEAQREYNRYATAEMAGIKGAEFGTFKNPSDEEVERVAKAMWNADPQASDYCWMKYGESDYIPMAKAAIAAMKKGG